MTTVARIANEPSSFLLANARRSSSCCAAKVKDVVVRREILLEAFGYDFDPGANVIDVHVAHLRQKLKGSHAKLETVRGSGFRLRATDASDA